MQNLSRINEPETIVNYRRQDDVFGYDLQFLLSGVLPVLQNLSYKAQITRSEVLRRNNTVIKSYTKCILALGGLHEDKLCGILHAIAPTTVEMALLTSIFHIESNPDRLGLLSPTNSQRSQQEGVHITLQSVLFNKPKILNATYHTEIV